MNQIATTQETEPRYPEELVASTLFLLKRLGMKAKDLSVGAFEEAGLHPYHHAILALLDEGSPETQGSIAEALGYDKGMLVGFLDELEAAGSIERKRDPEDRRRHMVRMTPAGRRALEKARKLSRSLENEFLSGLTARERSELHSLLLSIAERELPNCRFAKR